MFFPNTATSPPTAISGIKAKKCEQQASARFDTGRSGYIRENRAKPIDGCFVNSRSAVRIRVSAFPPPQCAEISKNPQQPKSC